MDVLTLLREGINEPARRLLGGPVLVFKERALDRRSGRAVCFHWWLERDEETNDSAPAAADDEPSPVEIHDEGEALLVLIAAPDAKLETLKTEVRGRRLRLAVETAGGPFELAAPLPCRVAGAPIKVAFSNAVLSLWLAKETGR